MEIARRPRVARPLLFPLPRSDGAAEHVLARPMSVLTDLAMRQPQPDMLDRFAMRALLWGALAMCLGAGGLLSVGSSWHISSPLVLAAVTPLHALSLHAPTFAQMAPALSFTAFAMSIGGLFLLRRELARTSVATRPEQPETAARVKQLHDAMHANADGVFLLRAVRASDGTITDFEISDVNAAGTTLIRATGSVIGRRIRRDFPPILHHNLIERYAAILSARQSIAEELRVSPRLFTSSWLSHQIVPTDDGLVVTLRDVSARKREEHRLRQASLTDDLTRLYNRRGFLTLADQQLRIARRQMKDALLMYVDLDEFKELNDRYGHAEGDRALIAIGKLLRRAVRDCDVVARMGGDEFTIMALDADRAAARIIQRRIEERVALLNASGEFQTTIALTIGHTRVRPTDTASVTELLARADSLLYARKRRRKLTASATERVHSRQRARATINSRLGTGAGLAVPPDVAAIARAAAVAAAARVPATSVAAPFAASHSASQIA